MQPTNWEILEIKPTKTRIKIKYPAEEVVERRDNEREPLNIIKEELQTNGNWKLR